LEASLRIAKILWLSLVELPNSQHLWHMWRVRHPRTIRGYQIA